LGDSGALAGGALAAVAAIAAGVDLLWPVIAGPLLLEGLASLLQAKLLVPTYRRWRDPRLPSGAPLPHQRFPLPLVASPLHEHWVRVGLDRLQVVVLFWTATLATGVAGTLAPALWPSVGWVAAYGLGAGAVAGFWLAAAWLRPAFLLCVDGRLVVAHGRPWTIGRIRLFRVRGPAGDAVAVEAAQAAGLLGRPMNVHLLEEIVASLPAPEGRRE
ncbi:MAG: hypothetical protein FJ029_15750, partial [Actinobacteria bacterium]|nr:hypothetical protein [Actinomycetota bacterium]